MDKKLLNSLAVPIFALLAFGLFYIFWALLDLPPKEEVMRIAELYFETYGLATIFVAAMIESVLFVGWDFPGSLVIVLGVVFSRDDFVQLLGVYSVTTLAFIIAYALNFYVGKYGWYRLLLALGLRKPLENAQHQLTRYGPRAIFLTYWHPNLAALTSTAAGILQLPFRTFMTYSAAAAILLDVFWTVVGYRSEEH